MLFKTMLKPLGFFLFICSFFVLTGCNSGGEPITLKMNLKPGSSYFYDITTEQSISQQLMEQSFDIQQTMSFGYRMDVKDVNNDGDLTITYIIDRIRFHQELPQGGSIDYDSKNPTDSLKGMASTMASIYGAMKGAAFTLLMSPQGKVKDISGYEEMMSNMINNMKNVPDSLKEQMQAAIKEQVSEQVLRENIENTWNIFPEQEVRKGDTWTKSMKSTFGLPMTMENRYKLQNVSNNSVEIQVDADIQTGGAPEGMPMNTTYSLSGKQKGTMKISRETGMIESSEMSQEMAGETKIEGMGATPMQIPMKITGKVTVNSRDSGN